jgi:hypothetical protein
MSYDALIITLSLIGGLSLLFMVLAIVADVIWPLATSRPWRTPRRQATYTRRPQ